MITGIILSFFGASCLASLIVFAACVASSRADQIQQGAFEHAHVAGGRFAGAEGQQLVAQPQLTLTSSAV